MRNLKETLEMLGVDGQVHSRPPKIQILTVVLLNFQKSAVRQSMEILLYFVDFSAVVCVSQSSILDLSVKYRFGNKSYSIFVLKAEFSWSCRIFWKKLKLKRKISGNHGKIICSLFHILAQFPFTTSETQVDYYHQRLNIRVA